MSRVRLRRRIAGGLCSAIAVLGVSLAQAPTASADYALGCFFAAYTPYKATDGRIWSKVLIRCRVDTQLIVTGNLKKDRWAFPDATVGSVVDTGIYSGGRYYTYWVPNNRVTCPGSGRYYGIVAIRRASFSTAYTSRSLMSQVNHC